jgi:hypothetical protein
MLSKVKAKLNTLIGKLRAIEQEVAQQQRLPIDPEN